CFFETRPTRSVRRVRSSVTICETLATESLPSPEVRAARSTFPGALAHLRLLVSGTHTTVARRLRLRGSPCTTSTGRRNPGPDPTGSGRPAQQTSPCAITTQIAPAPDAQHSTRTILVVCPSERRRRSWLP